MLTCMRHNDEISYSLIIAIRAIIAANNLHVYSIMLTSGTTDNLKKIPLVYVLDHLDVHGVINICVSSRYSCTLCIFCVITHHIVTNIPQFD